MKSIIKNILLLLLSSCVIIAAQFMLIFVIAKKFAISIDDARFLAGLGTSIIGFMSMMQGNPAGTVASNSQQANFVNFEITRRERASTNYFKNFKNNSVLTSSFIGLSLVVAGVIMMFLQKASF